MKSKILWGLLILIFKSLRETHSCQTKSTPTQSPDPTLGEVTILLPRFCEINRNETMPKYTLSTQKKLDGILKNTFWNCTAMEGLYLAYNNIKELPIETFKFNTKLVALDLSYNKITTLNPAVLKPLINLKYLNINGNQLGSYQAILQEPLRNLEKVGISNIGISTINAAAVMTSLPNLKGISFDQNPMSCKEFYNAKIAFQSHQIEMIPGFRWDSNPYNPTCINVGNEFEFYEIRDGLKYLKPIYCEINKYKSSIDLSWEQINHVQENSFWGCREALEISLAHNKLTEIPVETFKFNQKVNRLDLGYNKLTNLSSALFEPFTNLTALEANGNNLGSYQWILQGSLRNLKKLIITNIGIDKIDPAEILAALPNLKIIAFDKNEIYCTDYYNASKMFVSNGVEIYELATYEGERSHPCVEKQE